MQSGTLEALVFDLELHWSSSPESPCPNCKHEGRPKTHTARLEALERLIVDGWLDPARRWPFPVPPFMRHLRGEPAEDGAR